MTYFKKIMIALMVLIILSLIFLIKFDTRIYIGDYSHTPTSIDLRAYIDNHLIFSDSLNSSPYFSTIVTKKMKYGFHEIKLISNKAIINQKTKIFLLPNQYIYVEFLGADTFRLNRTEVLDSMKLVEDSVFMGMDFNKTIVSTQSRFRVESLFNPFYTE